jgi:hypothetical protein
MVLENRLVAQSPCCVLYVNGGKENCTEWYVPVLPDVSRTALIISVFSSTLRYFRGVIYPAQCKKSPPKRVNLPFYTA